MAKLGIHKRGHGIARIIGDTVPSQKHKELMDLKSGQMQAPPTGQDIASAMGASPSGMSAAPGMKKGGSTNWIQNAIKKPGSLRASLHVKKGQKIPSKKLASAAKKSGVTGKRARLAMTLKSLKK